MTLRAIIDLHNTRIRAFVAEPNSDAPSRPVPIRRTETGTDAGRCLPPSQVPGHQAGVRSDLSARTRVTVLVLIAGTLIAATFAIIATLIAAEYYRARSLPSAVVHFAEVVGR